MKKYLFFFIGIWMSILYVDCERQPTRNERYGHIAVNFHYVDQPSGANIFHPGPPASTHKAGAIINDQVLLLHCDENSGFIARDASEYGNDFTLYEVGWDSSATAQLGRALSFDGEVSYALSESYEANHDELNGTHGLEISMMIFATGEELYYEKRLLDRMDYNGGYALGISDHHLFFKVRQNTEEFTVWSGTRLVSRTWYKITARFAAGTLSLFLNDELAGKEIDFAGTISPSYRQMVLGAGWSPASGIPTYNFRGRIDEVSIHSAVEYVDFDLIRLAVIDLSDFNSVNEFMGSEGWHTYHESFYTFMSDTNNVPTWDNWKKMWRDASFEIYSEQTLTIRGAFARGDVRGVEGLNLLALAGIRSGEIIYYGTGYAFVVAGGTVPADVEMWPASGW